MWPNPQFPIDLVTYTKEILNAKLYYFGSVNKYDWEGINCQSKADSRKKIEKNNITIAFMSCMLKKKKTYPAHVSKNNSKREKEVIIFIIVKRY